MLLIAVTPAPVWIGVLVIAWSTYVHRGYVRLGTSDRAALGLFAVTALHLVMACASVAGTHIYPIHWFPCWMGTYGTFIGAALLVLELGLVVALWLRWPRGDDGAKLGFRSRATMGFAFGLVALFAQIRSGALCTV